MAKFFKYANGRTVAVNRIIGTAIIPKDNQYKVVFELDVAASERNSVWSDPMSSVGECEKLIQSIPE